MTTRSIEFNRYISDYADTAIALIASIGVIFVALAGLILSYESLLNLAEVSGAVKTGLAWLWPLTLDTLAIVASLNVLWAETRQEHDWYAWTLVIVFTALSVVFNATHAGLSSLMTMSPYAPTVIAAFVGIVPPVAAALALHLVVRLIRRVMARAIIVTSIQDAEENLAILSTQVSDLTADIDALTQKRNHLQSDIDSLRTEKQAIVKGKRPYIPGDMDALDEANATRQAAINARRATVARLLQDKTLTISDIAETLEVSERTIQRDIVALNEQSNAQADAKHGQQSPR